MARKILLADDSVTAQNMGRKILADAGYEVITVNNGSAALKKVADAKPDLIVLDVYMPGYSGLEVCQRLKETAETSRIPILLTVGKLEPFKPEEAKRVRAEGFIVKPFEASELLSALAKLEDKVVPRADSSKPGRFARAIAAVEEGRYDNTVAIDEDSGWKNRIAFPSKKKAKAPEPEDGNDPAIYNPVNKDLKTVVDHGPARSAQPVKARDDRDEGHVDLGALSPEGLPKDVTAEEIAALAAAAAQVKGIVEANSSEKSQHASHPVETKVEAAPKDAATTEKPESSPAKIESADNLPHVEQKSAPTPESRESNHPASDFASQSPPTPEVATFATQKSQDEPTESIPALAEAIPHGSPQTAAGLSDAPAPSLNSSDPPSQEPSRQIQPEPVTMAQSAEPEHASRWTAVATALAPEEVGIVLEEEMRKVYAAFVGADSHASAPAGSLAAPQPITGAASVATDSREAEALHTASETAESAVAPKVEDPVSTVPEPAPEPMSARVKAFEMVAGNTVTAPSPAIVESAPLSSRDQSAAPEAAELPVAPEPAPVEPQVANAAPIPEAPLTSIEPTAFAESNPEKSAEPQSEVQAVAPQPVAQREEPPVVAAATTQEAPIAEEIRVAESASSAAVTEPAAVSAESTERIATADPTQRRAEEAVKKESEIAATTAAAWASWRRIRESGDSNAEPTPSAPAKSKTTAEPTSNDEAAMAVAAGAEKAPEETAASSEDTPEIANIVDSVLADLRPKIVEEISRKLKKKK